MLSVATARVQPWRNTAGNIPSTSWNTIFKVSEMPAHRPHTANILGCPGRRRCARPDLSHALHFHDGSRAERVRKFVALDDTQAELAFGGLGRGFGDLGGRVRALIEEYAGATAESGGKERCGAVQRGHGAGGDDGHAVRVQPLLGAFGAHFDIWQG